MRKHLRGLRDTLNNKILSKIIPNRIINYKNKGQINFIDVGSIGGLPKPWLTHANYIKFVLNFDPNEKVSRNTNRLTYNTSLFDREDTLPFYIYKGYNGTGSSMFNQNYEYVKSNFNKLKNRGSKHLANTWFERSELVKELKLRCRKLDNVLKEEFPQKPFSFMKIDAQGAEYNILKGSETLLKSSCIGLHLELFSLPLYKGIKLIDEVSEYLNELGFELIKKYPSHGSFDSQNDCLFLKTETSSKEMLVIRKVYNL